MKCAECKNPPMYFCPCIKVYVCSIHLGIHLEKPGKHSFEKLIDLPEEEEKEYIKSENIRLIKLIETNKSIIQQRIKNLILIVKKCAKSPLKNIDKHLMNVLKYLNDSTYLNQKNDIETVIESCKEFNYSLNPDLEKSWTNSFETELKD